MRLRIKIGSLEGLLLCIYPCVCVCFALLIYNSAVTDWPWLLVPVWLQIRRRPWERDIKKKQQQQHVQVECIQCAHSGPFANEWMTYTCVHTWGTAHCQCIWKVFSFELTSVGSRVTQGGEKHSGHASLTQISNENLFSYHQNNIKLQKNKLIYRVLILFFVFSVKICCEISSSVIKAHAVFGPPFGSRRDKSTQRAPCSSQRLEPELWRSPRTYQLFIFFTSQRRYLQRRVLEIMTTLCCKTRNHSLKGRAFR